MSTQLYLAPYDTGYVSRPNARASKVILYLTGSDSHSSVHAYPYKSWCISYVDAIPSTHTMIQADAEITLIPLWNDANHYVPITSLVSDLSAASRQSIATFLEAHRVPTGWIEGTMTIGRVIRFIVQILLTAQRLREDYPEFELDVQISSIPAAQRQRVLSWMNDNGIQTNDVDLSWTIRQVLERIVRDYSWSGVMELGTSLL